MPFDGTELLQDDAVLALLNDADQRLKAPEYWLQCDYTSEASGHTAWCLAAAIDWFSHPRDGDTSHPVYLAGQYLECALPYYAWRSKGEDGGTDIYGSIAYYNDDANMTFEGVKKVIKRAAQLRRADLYRGTA